MLSAVQTFTTDLLPFITAFILGSIQQGIPLLFGATGEIITEKSGNLNLGIPGIMYVGGISGIIGGYIYEHYAEVPEVFWCITIPFVSTLIGSALMSLIYSFLTITLRANQNVTGLAITTLGIGIGDFFGGTLVHFFGGEGSIYLGTTSKYYQTTLPFADKLGDIGKMLFKHGFMVYLAVIVAIITSVVLSKTKVGLNLKAVGENPATADAAGINVNKYKYLSTIIGGAIAGLGGLYFVIDYTGGGWTSGGFGDRGWLAVAIVIFALWKPTSAIWCSFLFGGLYIACVKLPLSTISKELIKMLPYVVTIIVLVFTSARKKPEHQPPAHLGLPYFREER